MPLRAPPSGIPLEIVLRARSAKSRTLDAVRTVSGGMRGGFFWGISCPDFVSLSDRFVVGTVP
jgi:hypothetical protein